MMKKHHKGYDGLPVHLYVHWPFCKNKCHYCDFVALEGHNAFMQRYHEALRAEIHHFFSCYQGSARPVIQTIYFGGGTPSLYPLELLQECMDTIRSYGDLAPDSECTLEVNPGGITPHDLATWRCIGFNRLSVGVQILDDQVLANLNRHQKTQDVYDLMRRAPQYFNNISADFIMGLPGVTMNVWRKSLEVAMTWPLTHISAYFLTVHENTPLATRLARGSLRSLGDDKMMARYTYLTHLLEQHQFEHYETSSYARPGFASRHNQAYWDRKPYKGFGIGAASFDGIRRSVNEKNLTRYMQYWLDGVQLSPARSQATSEVLSAHQVRIERIMLGLRQKRGLGLQDMIESAPACFNKKINQRLAELESAGMLIQRGDRITLTRKGMALENEVVLRLI